MTDKRQAMARSDRLFKKSYNEVLNRILLGQTFKSISGISQSVNVSRNTARRIKDELQNQKIINCQEQGWVIIRQPSLLDYYPEDETLDLEQRLEMGFMDWLFANNVQPGTSFHETTVARHLNVSVTSIREFLISFKRFGLISKEKQKKWIFEGFTKEYADELFEIRLLFELRSIEKLVLFPDTHVFWPLMERLRSNHLDIISNYSEKHENFPKLDARFHRVLNTYSGNRFIENIQDVISIIFHYHYLWNRFDEKERNLVALHEHMQIIDNIILKRPLEAKEALRKHLGTAQRTLVESISIVNAGR